MVLYYADRFTPITLSFDVFVRVKGVRWFTLLFGRAGTAGCLLFHLRTAACIKALQLHLQWCGRCNRQMEHKGHYHICTPCDQITSTPIQIKRVVSTILLLWVMHANPGALCFKWVLCKGSFALPLRPHHLFHSSVDQRLQGTEAMRSMISS